MFEILFTMYIHNQASQCHTKSFLPVKIENRVQLFLFIYELSSSGYNNSPLQSEKKQAVERATMAAGPGKKKNERDFDLLGQGIKTKKTKQPSCGFRTETGNKNMPWVLDLQRQSAGEDPCATDRGASQPQS